MACTVPGPSAEELQPQRHDVSFPEPLFFARRMLQADVCERLGVQHQHVGLVGAVTLDTFGDLIPPKTLHPGRDGAFGWIKREGGQLYQLPQACGPSVQYRVD